MKLRPDVTKELLTRLTRVSHWKSPLLCVFLYVMAVFLAWIGGPASGYTLAIPAFVLIAGIQMNLLILQHEGSHLLVHPNPRVNDFVTDVFCGVPFFAFLKNYRALHLPHHKYTGNPERDPEVRFYRDQKYTYATRPWPQALWMLACDLFLVNLVRFQLTNARFLAEERQKGRLQAIHVRDIILFLGVWGSVATLASVTHMWLALGVFWILPMFTLTYFLLKLHSYGEHTGASGPSEYDRTWVHLFNPVTNFFIYPLRSGLHLEHHLFPRVPWYNLRALRQLMLTHPDYVRASGPVTVRAYFFARKSTFNTQVVTTKHTPLRVAPAKDRSASR